MSRLRDALDRIAFARTYTTGLLDTIDPADWFRTPAEIRATFDRVHRQVLADLADFPDADLDSSIDPPHRIAKTKLATLHWCADHELIHAGQIALLRRLFGQRPVW